MGSKALVFWGLMGIQNVVPCELIVTDTLTDRCMGYIWLYVARSLFSSTIDL